MTLAPTKRSPHSVSLLAPCGLGALLAVLGGVSAHAQNVAIAPWAADLGVPAVAYAADTPVPARHTTEGARDIPVAVDALREQSPRQSVADGTHVTTAAPPLTRKTTIEVSYSDDTDSQTRPPSRP